MLEQSEEAVRGSPAALVGDGMEGGSMPFPPNREADLVTWTGTFSALVSGSPTTYGLTAPQATAYATLSTAFVDSFNIANAEETRTRVTVADKNAAKFAMIANARMLIRIIQGVPTVTPAMKIALGINPHDTLPTPIPPPAVAPQLLVKKSV